MLRKNIIKFKFKENYRTFKKGEVIELKLDMWTPNYLVGNNRSGKTTLLQILRSRKDNLKEINKGLTDGIGNPAIEKIGVETKDIVEIEGFDYDYAFFMDSVIDDPELLNNSATAYAVIAGGGLVSTKMSKGEKTLINIGRFFNKIDDVLKNLSPEDILDKNFLIVVDEVDEGFDMRLQLRFNDMLINKAIFGYGANVISVTHNPLCLLTNKGKKVYDVEKRKYVSAKNYVKEITGYNISLKKIDNGDTDKN